MSPVEKAKPKETMDQVYSGIEAFVMHLINKRIAEIPERFYPRRTKNE